MRLYVPRCCETGERHRPNDDLAAVRIMTAIDLSSVILDGRSIPPRRPGEPEEYLSLGFFHLDISPKPHSWMRVRCRRKLVKLVGSVVIQSSKSACLCKMYIKVSGRLLTRLRAKQRGANREKRLLLCQPPFFGK